jgi:hypothetical protein
MAEARSGPSYLKIAGLAARTAETCFAVAFESLNSGSGRAFAEKRL